MPPVIRDSKISRKIGRNGTAGPISRTAATPIQLPGDRAAAAAATTATTPYRILDENGEGVHTRIVMGTILI